MGTNGSGTAGGRAATVRIAGYEDMVEIGRGGFAVVHRARRVDFGQEVAIKVLDPARVDSHGVSRFDRERRILGLLAQHPNVVTVYDAGTTPDGAPYLVMEYLPGGSLGDRLARQGPLDARRVVDIAVRLCGALETAHRAGVLHRDIKPDNILVSRYGDPVLADFGIARMRGGMQTQSGVVTATVGHAPPEVLDGHPPTARSDVYSLASTLFMLLAGAAPFAREGESGISALLVRVLRDPVPDLRPRGVPPEVCALLERAMAKDPSHRPASALEFGQAFQHLQRSLGSTASPLVVEDLDPGATGSDHLPVPDHTTPAPHPFPVTRASPAARRRRWPLLVVGAVLVLATAVVVPLLTIPEQQPETPAEIRGGPGTVTYTGAINPAPGRADLEVLDFGFTPVPTGTGTWLAGYGIRLRNPNPSEWEVISVKLTVRFTDDRGVVLGEGTETSVSIPPNGTAAARPDPGIARYDGSGDPYQPPAYPIRPTRMNIEVGDVAWRRVEDRVPGEITAGPAVLRPRPDQPGRFGERADVECTVTSTVDEEIRPVIVAVVFRNEAGVIVGGEGASIANDAGGDATPVEVPPRATTPLSLRLDSVPPEATSAECWPDYVLPVTAF